MKLSIIVPVFNEESTISRVLESLTRIQFPCAVEIIVVDDGSTDRTAASLALMNRDHIFKVHTSLINLGKGAAVRYGLEYAEGDYVVIQDADLELNPLDLLNLLQPVMTNGAQKGFREGPLVHDPRQHDTDELHERPFRKPVD